MFFQKHRNEFSISSKCFFLAATRKRLPSFCRASQRQALCKAFPQTGKKRPGLFKQIRKHRQRLHVRKARKMQLIIMNKDFEIFTPVLPRQFQQMHVLIRHPIHGRQQSGVFGCKKHTVHRGHLYKRRFLHVEIISRHIRIHKRRNSQKTGDLGDQCQMKARKIRITPFQPFKRIYQKREEFLILGFLS